MRHLFASVAHLLRIGLLAAPIAVTASVPVLQGCGGSGSTSSSGQSCCRTCDTGKACGDACIPLTSTCNTPSGCACNK